MLSPYHEKYLHRSEQDISQRIRAKREEFRQIFEQSGYSPEGYDLHAAVLGCGYKGFVRAHADMLRELLKQDVDVTTFDITVQHLEGEPNVIEHDCTLPLPGGPYDIVYSSILLKFIETEKQWDVLKNSYDALAEKGIAIHLLDPEEIYAPSEKLPDGLWAVPLAMWKEKLGQAGISYSEIIVKTGPDLDSDCLAFILHKEPKTQS